MKFWKLKFQLFQELHIGILSEKREEEEKEGDKWTLKKNSKFFGAKKFVTSLCLETFVVFRI